MGGQFSRRSCGKFHQIGRHTGMHRQYGDNIPDMKPIEKIVRTMHYAMFLGQGHQFHTRNNISPIIVMVFSNHPIKRTITGTIDPILRKMSPPINHRLIPVPVDVHHRAFHCQSDIIPARKNRFSIVLHHKKQSFTGEFHRPHQNDRPMNRKAYPLKEILS